MPREEIMVSGRGGEMNLRNIVRSYSARGLATEYDELIAKKLARVLTDGSVACIHAVSEERILELEHEAFMSLAGEERTKQRIVHMLKSGKPLRN
jgi:3-hydroxyacyl-CoA dehydrogenase